MILKNLSGDKKILLVVFVLVLLAGTVFLVWKNHSSKPEVKTVPSDSESRDLEPQDLCGGGVCSLESGLASGFRNEQIGKAITEYVLAQKNFSWKTDSESFNFCAVKNLQPENELFPYYVWLYCAEYGMEGGKLTLLSGTSLPAKIDYPNELSFFDLSKFSHEVARDGSFNGPDIARIFPESVRNRFSEFDRAGTVKKMEAAALAAIASWESAKQAVSECRAAKIFQAHSRNVSLELKDGSKLSAVEPEIDRIIAIVDGAKAKCGDISIATE